MRAVYWNVRWDIYNIIVPSKLLISANWYYAYLLIYHMVAVLLHDSSLQPDKCFCVPYCRWIGYRGKANDLFLRLIKQSWHLLFCLAFRRLSNILHFTSQELCSVMYFSFSLPWHLLINSLWNMTKPLFFWWSFLRNKPSSNSVMVNEKRVVVLETIEINPGYIIIQTWSCGCLVP